MMIKIIFMMVVMWFENRVVRKKGNKYTIVSDGLSNVLLKNVPKSASNRHILTIATWLVTLMIARGGMSKLFFRK